MNTCETCSNWGPAYTHDDGTLRDDGKLRRCGSPYLTEDFYQSFPKYNALVYPYQEGGWFDTGANFGCVHHQQKGETK
jgi:hypothetical protein